MSLSPRRLDADFDRRISWESGPENGPWITLTIRALPTVNITENRVANTMHCAVCRDEFEVGGEAIKLPCKHLYHQDCIVSWMNIKTTCPICRFKIDGDSNNTASDETYETSEMNHRDIGVEDLAYGLTCLLSSRPLRVFSHWTRRYLDPFDSVISHHNFTQEGRICYQSLITCMFAVYITVIAK
ncbi:Detected protein of unknown function [Hibiscus syriacus]|uniref:RING-type domain-containing protein n=1 Tax=Hibiscus syriacus TaxID=106335 RepID=A0A6A2ZM14_HIBSY|nr:Detected protein of unknown function [Hibiscus syriacus]